MNFVLYSEKPIEIEKMYYGAILQHKKKSSARYKRLLLRSIYFLGIFTRFKNQMENSIENEKFNEYNMNLLNIIL